MQQLCDMLAHKLSLAHSPPPPDPPAKDALLELLLLEKKREALRVLVETRLQQSMDGRRVTEGEELSHFLSSTRRVMLLHDPALPLPLDAPLPALVQLFVLFFHRQGCSHRAEEISNIYRKKLCPKGLLPSTLFNWFVEWTRKHFQEYLKTTIHSLYVDSRQSKAPTPKEPPKEEEPSYLTVHKKTKHLSRSIQVTSHREKRELMSLELNEKRADKPRMKSQSPSQKSLKLAYESIEQEDLLPINKEIFYYAYAEEFQALYRHLEGCLPDLELGFVRRLKKGGRRQEVKKRIKEVAANIIKHMPVIRDSIDQYRNAYLLAHPAPQRKKGERKITIDSPSKTSHAKRSLSIEKAGEERRKSLISSLSKKHRYAASQDEQSSQSNLLAGRATPAHKDRSIDISFSAPRGRHQSKFLVISTGYVSAQLQIIQEKVRKIKAKAGRRRKKSLGSSRGESIDFGECLGVGGVGGVRLPRLGRR